MEDLMGRCNRQEIESVAAIAKRIWAWRNQVLHRNEFTHPNRIVTEAEASLYLFQQIQWGKAEKPVEIPPKWQPPPFGRYKINWDVAVENSLQAIGVGIMVRDHRGQVHATRSRTIQSFHEPVMAEALGAVMAAEFGRDLGLQDISLEGDSLLMVKAIREPGTQWSSCGHLVEDARRVLNTNRSWTIGHVKREANSAARTLAKEAVKGVIDQNGEFTNTNTNK